MRFSEQEFQWRDTLRTKKNPRPDLNTTCSKYERNSLKTTLLSSYANRKNPKIFLTPQKSFSAKDLSKKSKHYLTANYSKFTSIHHELIKNFEEIIKKQQEEINAVALENQAIEMKINRLHSAGMVKVESPLMVVAEEDSNDRVLNYYKSGIKTVENLIEKQKNDYKNKMLELSMEKKKLEDSLAGKKREESKQEN